MRGVNGDSRAADTNAFDIINAAATAIASAENRLPQASIQKRRWGSCWSAYWCFGYHRNRKRIGHADPVPETAAPRNDVPVAENPPQAPAIMLPFVAPPSSPASFLQSEPPSAAQSPAGILSHNSISANMYSPSGPASIFAIGPYAHETQLVSPPVFSAFTTEPSTAPFTPPPESVHLTTPSSPEVPFALLLDPRLRNGETGQRFPFSNYEFQSYQLYPGSPVGPLISPSSGISGSGTSSPFPDAEFSNGGLHFLDFPMNDPPKFLNLDKLSTCEWGLRKGSGSLTPDAVRTTSRRFLLDRQLSDVASHPHSFNGCQNDHVAGNKVSFERTAEEFLRCVKQKPTYSVNAMPEFQENGTTTDKEASSTEHAHSSERDVGETSTDKPEKASTNWEEAPWLQKNQSITFRPGVNFDNPDEGESLKPVNGKEAPHHQKNSSIIFGHGFNFVSIDKGDSLKPVNGEEAPQHQKNPSLTFGPGLNFDNVDGGDSPETVNGKEAPRHQKNQSITFNPVLNFGNADKGDSIKLGNREESSRHQKNESITFGPAFNFDNANEAVSLKALNAKEAPRHQKNESITLGPVFNFDDGADKGDSLKPNIGPDWWANGLVVGKEVAVSKNWSFPMVQPGVS